MFNTLFKYFYQIAGAGRGRYHRILSEEAMPYFEKLMNDGSPKYKEVTFKEWFAEMPEADKAKKMEGAPEGMFYGFDVQEGRMLLSLETGEPADVSELPEGVEQPHDAVMTTDAPADELVAPESTETTEDEPSTETTPEVAPSEAGEAVEGAETV